MGEPLGVAPLLVEAYVGAGRADDAQGLAQRFSAIPEPDGRTAALIARCRGLTEADHAIVVEAFEAALAAHVHSSDAQFERTRTELLYGARRRRFGQRIAAREGLPAARDDFETTGLGFANGRAARAVAPSS